MAWECAADNADCPASLFLTFSSVISVPYGVTLVASSRHTNQIFTYARARVLPGARAQLMQFAYFCAKLLHSVCSYFLPNHLRAAVDQKQTLVMITMGVLLEPPHAFSTCFPLTKYDMWA